MQGNNTQHSVKGHLRQVGGALVVECSAAPALTDVLPELESRVSEDGVSAVLVDLSAMPTLKGEGLEALMQVRELGADAGRKVVAFGVSFYVKQLIKVLDLDGRLPEMLSVDEAGALEHIGAGVDSAADGDFEFDFSDDGEAEMKQAATVKFTRDELIGEAETEATEAIDGGSGSLLAVDFSDYAGPVSAGAAVDDETFEIELDAELAQADTDKFSASEISSEIEQEKDRSRDSRSRKTEVMEPFDGVEEFADDDETQADGQPVPAAKSDGPPLLGVDFDDYEPELLDLDSDTPSDGIRVHPVHVVETSVESSEFVFDDGPEPTPTRPKSEPLFGGNDEDSGYSPVGDFSAPPSPPPVAPPPPPAAVPPPPPAAEAPAAETRPSLEEMMAGPSDEDLKFSSMETQEMQVPFALLQQQKAPSGRRKGDTPTEEIPALEMPEGGADSAPAASAPAEPPTERPTEPSPTEPTPTEAAQPGPSAATPPAATAPGAATAAGGFGGGGMYDAVDNDMSDMTVMGRIDPDALQRAMALYANESGPDFGEGSVINNAAAALDEELANLPGAASETVTEDAAAEAVRKAAEAAAAEERRRIEEEKQRLEEEKQRLEEERRKLQEELEAMRRQKDLEAQLASSRQADQAALVEQIQQRKDDEAKAAAAAANLDDQFRNLRDTDVAEVAEQLARRKAEAEAAKAGGGMEDEFKAAADAERKRLEEEVAAARARKKKGSFKDWTGDLVGSLKEGTGDDDAPDDAVRKPSKAPRRKDTEDVIRTEEETARRAMERAQRAKDLERAEELKQFVGEYMIETGLHMRILGLLKNSPGKAKGKKDVAGAVGASSAVVGQILDDFVESKLVKRVRNPRIRGGYGYSFSASPKTRNRIASLLRLSREGSEWPCL